MPAAIKVYFIGPTATKPARWRAVKNDRGLTLIQDDGLGPEDNAERAAAALADQLGWDGSVLHRGAVADGFVFVRVTEYDLKILALQLADRLVEAHVEPNIAFARCGLTYIPD